MTMDHSTGPAQRQRSDTHFSFRSNKSNDSPGKSKHEKKDSATKIHYDPKGKANPNAAMEEAQPSMTAPQSSCSGVLHRVCKPVC